MMALQSPQEVQAMRQCEFCAGPVDESTNICGSCGATQSTWPQTPSGGPPPAPVPKASALWLGWIFTPWLSGIGIIWIGIRASRTDWIVEGSIYMLPFLTFAFSSQTEPSDAQTVLALIAWALSIYRALKMKNEYNAIMATKNT